MKKIEFIWRHLLFDAIENRRTSFRQQDLASQFHLSSSTVNLSLRPLRALGAVKVGSRGFTVIDTDKILYHWANQHRLQPQVQISVNLPILEIEGRLPDHTTPTAYTAVRERFGEPPADYDKVYCYHFQPEAVASRFAPDTLPGPPNLFVLPADPYLTNYGSRVPLGHLFADLWQLPDWYAKDFVNLVKTHLDGLLS